MMRNNLFLVGMLLTVALLPSASAAELAEEQCSGPHLVECLLREADEFIDGAQDEVEDMCDSATGDCPVLLAGIETSSGQLAVVAACEDGETAVECAERETIELWRGVKGEVDGFCDAFLGSCPFGSDCETSTESPLQCNLRLVRTFIDDLTSADTAQATVAECRPGESVLECTVYEAREECRRLLDNCPLAPDATCQPGETALQCLVRILTGGVWTETYAGTTVAACREGESAVECADRETDELVAGVRGEVHEYCNDMVGGCPGSYCGTEPPLQCYERQVQEFINA